MTLPIRAFLLVDSLSGPALDSVTFPLHFTRFSWFSEIKKKSFIGLTSVPFIAYRRYEWSVLLPLHDSSLVFDPKDDPMRKNNEESYPSFSHIKTINTYIHTHTYTHAILTFPPIHLLFSWLVLLFFYLKSVKLKFAHLRWGPPPPISFAYSWPDHLFFFFFIIWVYSSLHNCRIDSVRIEKKSYFSVR